MQARKTHEQHVRMLERKPDVPGARRTEAELGEPRARAARRRGRQASFPVSRGGLNQESQHNKHNHQSQTGHKPPKTCG